MCMAGFGKLNNCLLLTLDAVYSNQDVCVCVSAAWTSVRRCVHGSSSW